MNTVIYNEALEPVTVIDLHPQYFTTLREGFRMRMHAFVNSQVMRTFIDTGEEVPRLEFRDFELYAHELEFRGRRSWFVFTTSEQGARSLPASLLPGQADHMGRHGRSWP